MGDLDALSGPLARLPAPVKAGVRDAVYGLLRARQRRAPGPAPEAIWILGHMRSGSSLLAHIIISHPEILGHGERNAVYRGPADLDTLAVDSYYHRRVLHRRFRLFADQINHTRLVEDPSLLDHPRVHPVFLLREPRGTVASMVEVLGRHYGTTLDEAVDYYTRRVTDLQGQVEGLADPARATFVTYQALTEDPQSALAKIQGHLGLTRAFSTSYRRFSFTGRRGDPSSTIAEGRVRPPRAPRALDLPAAQADQVQAAYEGCLAAMTRRLGERRGP